MNLTIRGFDFNKKLLDIDYCTCDKSINGWETFEFSEKVFNIKDIEFKEKLENIMYKEMCLVGQKFNKHWNKFN